MRHFDRALTREMAGTAAATFAALLSIFLVVVLVRVLGKAAMGDLEAGAVPPMLAFGVMRFLPVLFSLALFVGVFMSLTRTWRDSEAVIWMGAGLGPWGWIRPVLLFAVPMVALVALVSFAALPWAAKKQLEYERILEAREAVSVLVPGMFTEYGDGRRVHFVESIDTGEQRVGNVFIQSETHGRTGVLVARQGHVDTQENGERFLVLEAGRRYEGNPGEADFRLVEFESYAVRIPPQAVEDITNSPRTLSMAQLWASPSAANMGEWVWRMGYPLSALLLVLLAVPLSYVNPRAGKSLNVVFAILLYVAYNNFVGLSEGWVTHGHMGAAEALLAIHGGMLLILLALYWRRFRGPWA